MNRRAAGLAWLALLLTGICLGWVVPRWGGSALQRIHFEHPDDDTRARALRIRALSRWEEAQRRSDLRVDLMAGAEADLDAADRIDSEGALSALRREISGNPE